MAGATSEQRRLDGGGVLERGLGLDSLPGLTAFLAKVSTKFDLIAPATEDKVARRRPEGSMGKGETVPAAEDVERSLSCKHQVLLGYIIFTPGLCIEYSHICSMH
jgi:hypothetical protein